MKILIDGRFIGVGESVSRYTLEIVRGILALDKSNQYTLLIRPAGVKAVKEWLNVVVRSSSGQGNEARIGSIERLRNYSSLSGLRAEGRQTPNDTDLVTDKRYPNLTVCILDIPHYSVAEQTRLLSYLNAKKFDLVHFTQFNHPLRYRGRYVVTVHDLTMFGHLHRQNSLKRIAFRAVMKSAVHDSAKIITVSGTSKKDIIETYRVSPQKIAVIYNGVDHSVYSAKAKGQRPKARGFKEKYSIDRDYLLYAGMWKKHKNLLRLLKAYEIFAKDQRPKAEGVKLVLAGKVDNKESEILMAIERINKAFSLQPSTFGVITTGYIEESELPSVYAGALAYVMPSLSEGFGLPPLEAMACGTPVIAAQTSSMPEILGRAPLYFDPYNVKDIAAAMERIVADSDLRARLAEAGLVQAARYSWAKTARETLGVYKSLL
ncbi:MAG: glycosyltransferase family 1 protein [Patescibacteria group bacterium]